MLQSNAFKLFTFLVLSVSAVLSSSAHARDGYGARYHTTYRNFDRGFHENYSYDERVRYRQCGYYTCYDGFSDSTPVYVEEVIVEKGTYSGYTKVYVYSTSTYQDPYATYYTYNGTVIRRDYNYRQRHLTPIYRHTSYSYYPESYYIQLDQFTAELLVGMTFVNIGANVMANCHTQECAAVGLVSMVAGSISMSIASAREEQRRDTALSRRIAKLEEEQNRAGRNLE